MYTQTIHNINQGCVRSMVNLSSCIEDGALWGPNIAWWGGGGREALAPKALWIRLPIDDTYVLHVHTGNAHKI